MLGIVVGGSVFVVFVAEIGAVITIGIEVFAFAFAVVAIAAIAAIAVVGAIAITVLPVRGAIVVGVYPFEGFSVAVTSSAQLTPFTAAEPSPREPTADGGFQVVVDDVGVCAARCGSRCCSHSVRWCSRKKPKWPMRWPLASCRPRRTRCCCALT